jgi:hypothetical protein
MLNPRLPCPQICPKGRKRDDPRNPRWGCCSMGIIFRQPPEPHGKLGLEDAEAPNNVHAAGWLLVITFDVHRRVFLSRPHLAASALTIPPAWGGNLCAVQRAMVWSCTAPPPHGAEATRAPPHASVSTYRTVHHILHRRHALGDSSACSTLANVFAWARHGNRSLTTQQPSTSLARTSPCSLHRCSLLPPLWVTGTWLAGGIRLTTIPNNQFGTLWLRSRALGRPVAPPVISLLDSTGRRCHPRPAGKKRHDARTLLKVGANLRVEALRHGTIVSSGAVC